MNARIVLSRSFERDLGGFDHRDIVCRIIDSKFGPLAYAMGDVAISTAFEKAETVVKKGEEVELTEGEVSDAQKILDRINK